MSAGREVQRRREPVSVVCVYNDEAVRRQCLDRSLDAGASQATDLQYIPVDNRRQAFTSAGAALNHGARAATNPFVVFVHQDVYLHSLQALEEAAGLLAAHPSVGLVGAVGIDGSDTMVGRIRDRVDLSGRRVHGMEDVESVDEVLFVVERERVLRDPISEADALAWHAYAVEYGARIRRAGLTVAVADIPLTHNSLTANLARLDVAHRSIAAQYPDLLPIHTTCGLVTSPSQRPWPTVGSGVRAGARQIRDLLTARRHVGWRPDVMVANLRFEIDRLISGHRGAIRVINLTDDGCFAPPEEPLTMTRRGQTVHLSTAALRHVIPMLDRLGHDESVFVTDIAAADVRSVVDAVPAAVVGYDPSTGFWLVTGAIARVRRQDQRWNGSRTPGLVSLMPQRSRTEQGMLTA